MDLPNNKIMVSAWTKELLASQKTDFTFLNAKMLFASSLKWECCWKTTMVSQWDSTALEIRRKWIALILAVSTWLKCVVLTILGW